MVESSASQIEVYPLIECENAIKLDVETFNKVGRKAKVTKDKYLDAVKRKRTNKDITIAEYLGVHRSNIGRFKKNNPVVVKEAEEILKKYTSITFDAKNLTYEAFIQIPIIEKWVEIQEHRIVGNNLKRKRLRAMYNVCKFLNVHPENLTLEQVATLVTDAKTAYYSNKKFINGLAYLSIRKVIRSFFQLVHGISGEYLSSIGIDAKSCKGAGSSSKERVTKEHREMFMKVLKKATYEVINNPKYPRFEQYKGLEDLVCCEMKGLTYFMYYTGTRIGANNPDKKGSLSVRLNNSNHLIAKSKWRINVIDKGKRGGIEWNKIMLDDAILKLREYVSDRFDITIDEVERRMIKTNSYMFPILNKNYNLERIIMKRALLMSGVETRNTNHIWRHTFAQDFLHASDWNYELCASLGGWKDTGTLKKHYGEMSEDAKDRGLQKAMGLEPYNVTHELRW